MKPKVSDEVIAQSFEKAGKPDTKRFEDVYEKGDLQVKMPTEAEKRAAEAEAANPEYDQYNWEGEDEN